MNQALSRMRREFQDFSHTTRSYHETLTIQEKRNMRLLDVVQSGLLTSALETESRLEDKRSGAA